MLEKSNQFLSSEQPCEPQSLDVALNIARVEKYTRKTCGCDQSGGHSIRVLNEKSVSDGGNLSPLWLVNLKSVWNSVGDTFQLRYSWPSAVVSYTLLAAVPWNGLEHSHPKARLCVSKLILKSDVLMCHSLHQSVFQQLIWDWEKLNFLNKFIS